MKKFALPFIFIVLFLFGLFLVKGSTGNGLEQARSVSSLGQAFESSISAGRYALLLSIVEDHSLNLSQELANFSAPDVSRLSDGRFVSIWPPGSAFILAPFYMLGKLFGAGQLGVTIAFILFGVLNSVLIYKLALRLGIKTYIAVLGGIIYLIASNALVYSIILSQHQITVLLMLLCANLAISKNSFIKHILIWFLYGVSIVVDLPNGALLAPILAYVFFRDILQIDVQQQKLKVKFNYLLILPIFIVILPIALMLQYNYQTTSNYMGFGQTYTRYTLGKAPKVVGDDLATSAQQKAKVFSLPFDINRMPFGINTLLFSSERGILYYAPVFLLACLGISKLYSDHEDETKMLLGLFLTGLLLYSMFGDVQGGWSFGPRYMIPGFAILAIFVAAAVEKYSKNVLFIILFTASAIFSIIVNTLGAISTILIPPVHEASGLGLDPTINVSIKFLQEKPLGSYVFNNFLKNLNNVQFYYLMVGLFIAIFLVVLFKSLWINPNEKLS